MDTYMCIMYMAVIFSTAHVVAAAGPAAPTVPSCPAPPPPHRTVQEGSWRVGSGAAAASNKSAGNAGPNLVPSTLSTAPHYYTTWASQGYMSGDCFTNLTIDYVFSHQGNNGQQQALDSDYLFGKSGLAGSGWLKSFYPESRGELFFMLDQGYATGDGTIEPNPAHFPQWNQTDPGTCNLCNLQLKCAATNQC